MKKVINSIFLLISLCLLFLEACTSNDYNKETTSTEVTVPDTSKVTMPETSQQMMTGNSQMMGTDTSGKASTTKTQDALKGKKGKVSTTMMMNSGKNMPMKEDKQGYYSSVEILPVFPGGQNALNDFVSRNIEYPADANDHSIEGVVTVNFAVDEAGKVSNPKIIGKPLGYGLEDEVLKAVNKMPT